MAQEMIWNQSGSYSDGSKFDGRFNKKKQLTDSCCQTGNSENVFHLTENKTLKLYYSNVYKEKVISLSLSSSKSFIFTLKTWKKFRKIIPNIEEHFANE